MDFLTTIVAAVQPYILEVIGALALAVLTSAAGAIKKKTGIDIEEKHMRALHSAIMSGVQLAMSRGAHGAVDEIKDIAKNYVSKSVPDALASLSPEDSLLDDLIEGALAKVSGGVND